MIYLIHIPICPCRCNWYFNTTTLILNCDLRTHFHFSRYIVASVWSFTYWHCDDSQPIWFEGKQLGIKKTPPNIPSANLQEQSPHSLFWSWNVGYSPSVANTRETIRQRSSKVYLHPLKSGRSVICDINCICIVLTDLYRAWATFRWSCQTITNFHSLLDLLQGLGIFSWEIWAFLAVLFHFFKKLWLCLYGGWADLGLLNKVFKSAIYFVIPDHEQYGIEPCFEWLPYKKFQNSQIIL